jgi:membrane protease YdiL (CAAX protease family)
MENNKSYLSIGLSFGMLGIKILAALIFAPLVYILPKYVGEETSQLIYYVLMSITALYILCLIRKRKSNEKSFSVSFSNMSTIPFIILGGWFLLFGAIFPLVDLIPVPELIQAEFEKVGGGTGIASFLLMVIIAPVFEELVYRGIILDGLLKKYSALVAILISSLIFGIAHLNPWQFIPGFMVGAFAGWIYYRTKNLTLTMILHATVNLVGYFQIIYIDVISKYETVVDLYGGLTRYIFIIIACSVLFVGCILCLKKTFNKH